jgi:signal transduction histidine kinase/CheY-like chemotaxis protein/ligand-binding sensor domain-containing protein
MKSNLPEKNGRLQVKNCIILMLWLFLGFCPEIYPQLNFTNPIRITKLQGFDGGSVHTILQDSKGFYWFGTTNGLGFFDGTYVRMYKNIPGDSTSLSNNEIRSLYFDKERNCLWIGTINGLNRLDLYTGKIKKYFFQKDKTGSLPENELGHSIFKDHQGILWIGLAREGLAKYDASKDNFEHFKYTVTSADIGERKDFSNYIRAIDQDKSDDSILWTGTASGLLKFNKYTGKFKRYYLNIGNKNEKIAINATSCMYVHTGGQVYLGCWRNKLLIFDPKSESYSYVIPALNTIFPSGEGVVRNILLKSDNELYVTTYQGLAIFNTLTNTVTSEFLNDFSNKSIIGAFYKESNGRVWGGSQYGVAIFDVLNEQFEHIPLPRNFHSRFAPMAVTDAPNDQTMYVTAAGGDGLYTVDRNKGSWELIRPVSGYIEKGKYFNGRDLLWLKDGRLLIIEENGLFTLSRDRQVLELFPLQTGDAGAKMMHAIEDRFGNVWIGTIYGGLFKLNLEKKTVRNYKAELLPNGNKQKSLIIKAIHEDHDGNIWCNSYNGCAVYIHRLDSFIYIPLTPNSEGLHISPNGFIEYKNNQILALTDAAEFNKICDFTNPANPVIRNSPFRKDSDFRVTSKIVDGHGNLWLTDKRRLRKINLKSFQVTDYDGGDGLNVQGEGIDLLNINKFSLLKSGEIVLSYGYGEGLGIFDPKKLATNTNPPPLYFTRMTHYDGRLRQEIEEKAIPYRNNLTFHHYDDLLSFEFVALDIRKSERNQYAYRLKGYNDEWIQLGNKRTVTFTNLDPGKYTLQVKGSNGDGYWNEKGASLSFRIKPPFWTTWWAYFLYVLLAICLLIALRKYELQRKLQASEAKHLKELDIAKTRLYTNVTHEFRSPLTIILGLSEQLEGLASESMKGSLRKIQNNGKQLLQLINQMLSLSKLESGMLPAQMVNFNIVQYLNYILDSYSEYARRKNIKLSSHSEKREILMDFDPEKFQMIVSNLLTNAIKFNKQDGEVVVSIKDRDHHTLELKISDTGAGIPADKLPHIFDRFYRAAYAEQMKIEGTGIGLALTRELVRLFNGEISVQSEPGKGSIFTVLLPINHNAEKAAVLPGVSVPQYTLRSSRTQPESAWTSSKLPRLLVIEDNDDLRTYLKHLLKQEYEVFTAADGEKGLEKVYQLMPDIIICDVMMPVLDGFQVCRKLKNDLMTCRIPIILLTAKSDADSLLFGLDCGADAYLSKPFEEKELRMRLRKMIQKAMREDRGYLAVQMTTDNEVNRRVVTAKDSELLGNLIHMIEKHIDYVDFNTHDLSRKMGLSDSTLLRKVKVLTGMSGSELIREVRLNKGAQLILESQFDMNLSQISEAVGFKSLSHFSKSFKAKFGCSPQAYKNRTEVKV